MCYHFYHFAYKMYHSYKISKIGYKLIVVEWFIYCQKYFIIQQDKTYQSIYKTLLITALLGLIHL